MGFARCGRLCRGPDGREGQIGSVLGPFVFDHAAVALDEHRLREPLVGMRLENVAEDFGFGRLQIRAQRGIEPLGEQRRAHADLARAGAQRQIALKPQMLKGEGEDGEDRYGHAADKSQWNRRGGERRRERGAQATLDRFARSASERRSEPKPSIPAQCFNWPHFE